jgi:hypothetical protein
MAPKAVPKTARTDCTHEVDPATLFRPALPGIFLPAALPAHTSDIAWHIRRADQGIRSFPPLSSKQLSAYNQSDHPYAISDSQSGI